MATKSASSRRTPAAEALEQTRRGGLSEPVPQESIEIMAVKIRIPTPLRKLTNEAEVVDINAATVGAAVTELQRQFPGIQERLVDEAGGIRRFVNVYVNEEDIRFLQNLDTPLKDGDEVSIIPAIAGG